MTWSEIPDEVDALVRDYVAIPRKGGGVVMSNVAGYVIDKMRDCAAKGYAWRDQALEAQEELSREVQRRQEAQDALESTGVTVDGIVAERIRAERAVISQALEDWKKQAERLRVERDLIRAQRDQMLVIAEEQAIIDDFKKTFQPTGLTDEQIASGLVAFARRWRDTASPNP